MATPADNLSFEKECRTLVEMEVIMDLCVESNISKRPSMITTGHVRNAIFGPNKGKSVDFYDLSFS